MNEDHLMGSSFSKSKKNSNGLLKSEKALVQNCCILMRIELNMVSLSSIVKCAPNPQQSENTMNRLMVFALSAVTFYLSKS